MRTRFLAILLLSACASAQMLQSISNAQKVPDPGTIIFTPSAGAVSNPTTVTFSGAATGSIYCSTQNGTTPATNLLGTGCTTGSLGNTTSITTAVTVKVVSGLLGDLDSPVASAAYTISGGGTPYTLDVHNVHDNNTSSSATAVVVVTGVTAGDLMVCEISTSGLVAFTSVSDNVNAGNYTAACTAHKNTTINEFYGIYYHTSTGAGTTTVTATIGSAEQFNAISCQAWKPGSGSTQTQDGSCVQRDVTSTANPTVAAGTTTPAGDNELIICHLGNDTSGPTAGTNYTLIDSQTSTFGWPEYWLQTTGTATNCPYTAASQNWTDQMAIFK